MQVRLTRRRLLGGLAGLVGSLLTAACQPSVVERERIVEKPVEVTRVVEVVKDKIVEKPVEVTRVVEKVVERKRTVEVEVTRVVTPTPGPIHMRVAVGSLAIEGVQLLARRYVEHNPHVRISVDGMSEEKYQQALDLFASGLTPDVAWLRCTPAYGFHRMVESKVLVPLDDLYKQEGWLDIFPQGVLDFQRQRDKHLYSVTLSLTWAPIVYYNKATFDRLKVEPPKTWDDLYALAATLREAGLQPLVMDYNAALLSRFPEAMQIRCWTSDQYRYMPLKWRQDAPPEADKYHWTDHDSVRIYSYTRAMVDRQVLVDGFETLREQAKARELFVAGKAAMYQAGSLEAKAAGVGKETRFQVGYFYYPPIRADKPEKVGAWAADGLVVPARGANLDEARRFVAWAFRTPQAAAYSQTVGLPSVRTDLLTKLYGDSLTPMQLDLAEDAIASGAPALSETLCSPAYYEAAAKSVDLMLAGGMAPEEAAGWLQGELEEIRAKDA